jgi:hypothetical protein
LLLRVRKSLHCAKNLCEDQFATNEFINVNWIPMKIPKHPQKQHLSVLWRRVRTIVIKPGPDWWVGPGAEPVRVCQKIGRCNDPAKLDRPGGSTRARPGVFFFQIWDLKPISIYYVPKKNYIFSMWDKKPFSLNTST